MDSRGSLRVQDIREEPALMENLEEMKLGSEAGWRCERRAGLKMS